MIKGPKGFWLDNYIANPGEQLMRPWLASSLFPGLPRRTQMGVGLALAAVVGLLTAFSLLRWHAPMIGVAIAGFPILLGIYLFHIGISRRVPRRSLIAVAVTGAVFGSGWAYVLNTVIADGYQSGVRFDLPERPPLIATVSWSICGTLLMLLATVVGRMLTRARKVPLDGLAVGQLGAAAFTAAGNAVLLAPQLADGVVADGRALHSLISEAMVQGLAAPLAAAATGGMFGLALWSRRGSRVLSRRLGAAAAAAVVIAAGFGLIDFLGLPDNLFATGYLVLSMLAVFALRIAVHTALPGEAEQPADRPARREYVKVLGSALAGLGLAAATAAGVSAAVTPGVAPYRCPPDCGRPPMGTPVAANPRFSPADGAFSVEYPGPGSSYTVTTNPNGVVLNYLAGDTGTLTLFGQQADGRTAPQIALDLIRQKFPSAAVDYEIPNASVGYQPGYGVTADVYTQNSLSKYGRLRVLVVVAVKRDYALIAAAVGPYHRFGPDFGSGHPSGANLELAMEIGRYVNSFRWRGDHY